METPLAVCDGENDPQEPGLPQVTDQSTPAFALSPVTLATRGAVVPCTIVLVGIACVIFTEIGATIVTKTFWKMAGPPATAWAVMVTTGLGTGLGAGTIGGAV